MDDFLSFVVIFSNRTLWNSGCRFMAIYYLMPKTQSARWQLSCFHASRAGVTVRRHSGGVVASFTPQLAAGS